MILNRTTIFGFIVADLLVMFFALSTLWDRVQVAQAQMIPSAVAAASRQPVDVPQTPVTSDPLSDAEMNAPLTQVAPSPANSVDASAQPASAVPTRRIRFTYRNSKSKHVEIIGDFNKWQPQSLSKGKNFEWYATFPLRPGEYTYNFIVDGKVIRDPNNPRTASEGRSLLTVKPLTE
jgi:hypothetical protein